MHSTIYNTIVIQLCTKSPTYHHYDTQIVYGIFVNIYCYRHIFNSEFVFVLAKRALIHLSDVVIPSVFANRYSSSVCMRFRIKTACDFHK